MTDQPHVDPRPLTIPEAAQYLQVSESTVYRMLRDDELRPVKLRGCTRISGNDLAKLFEDSQGGSN
jgi:excisionase family DNA binding protein